MYSHRRLPGAHEQLTIGQLTEKVFASEQAYMSFNAKLTLPQMVTLLTPHSNSIYMPR